MYMLCWKMYRMCSVTMVTGMCTLVILMTNTVAGSGIVRDASFVMTWGCNVTISDTPLRVLGMANVVKCAAVCLDNSTMCVSFILDTSDHSTVTCSLYQRLPSSPCASDTSYVYAFYKKADVVSGEETTTQSMANTMVNPCQNMGTYDGLSCSCPVGCSGQYCTNCYTDCSDGTTAGLSGDTVVTYIQPAGSPTAFQTLCNFDSAVTYIQYRRYGNISFYRDWQSYVDGFGDLLGDFWLGNKYIHLITNQKSYTCGVRLFDDTLTWRFDGYSKFVVADEVNNFKVTYNPMIVNFGMSPTDSTMVSDDQPFSTHDRDLTGCATSEKAGWWYNTGCTTGANANGMVPFDWSTFTGVTKTGMGLY